MSSLWGELIHELGTVRALSAAALEARTETSSAAQQRGECVLERLGGIVGELQ